MEKAVKTRYNATRTHKNIQEMVISDVSKRMNLKQQGKDARQSTFNFKAAFKEMDAAKQTEQEGEEFEFDMHRDMELTYMERSDLKKLENYDELQWFVDVCQLQEGQSFGELPLKDEEGSSLR